MPDEAPRALPALDDETLAFAARVFAFARGGCTAELGELLRMGLPANLRNEKGDSLLMLACYHGQAETARLLLDHGGDPELANDRGQTPLAAAAFKGDEGTVRLLLDRGARVEGAPPGAHTALMTAAMFDRTAILDLLLAHGADPGRRDAAGLDAEALAVRMGAAGTAARLGRLRGGSGADQ